MLQATIHFQESELLERQKRLQQKMQQEGIEGVMLFRQESLYYLTGFDTFGYVFFQALYFHHDGRMTLLTRAPDLRQAQLTSVIEDIRIWEDKPNSSPATDLLNIIRSYNNSPSGKVGVEWNAFGLTAYYGQQLVQIFVDYDLQDVSNWVSEFRVTKSETELAYVRRAAELADDGLDAAIAKTQAGAFEGDILSAMQGAIFCGGGEYSGNEFIIGSGQRALLCRSYAGRRYLSANDQLTLEFAGSYLHYHAALMRTLIVGEPTKQHQRMYTVALEAYNATQNALRPGEEIGSVFDAYAAVVDAAGMQAHRLNATGYSLGTTFAPSWMDWPMFYHGNTFIARPNMVFFIHIILMDSETQTAMTLGETFIVTADGAKGLSRHAPDLICK